MRKKSLTKDERKRQVIIWFAIRIQKDNTDVATMYEIASGLGMSPSSHLTAILLEMVSDGDLTAVEITKPGRWTGRGYMLPTGKYQLPQKRQIPLNFGGGKQARLEL